MKTVKFLFALFLFGNLFSFTIEKNIEAPTTQYQAFIPKGYVVLDTVSGDLNGDWRTDWVVVLKDIREDSLEAIGQETIRPLLVLLADNNNQLYEAHRADHIVFCKGCGGIWGDPYSGIEIVDHSFIVYHYGGSNWRWTRNLRFLCSGNDFLLVTDASTSFNVMSESDFSSTIKTTEDFGVIRMEDFKLED